MARITQHLNHLETVGLIRMAKTYPELEFMFRHALIQEAAYNSLLFEDRKKLHRQVGEAIEQTYPDQVASRELAPVLADHFAKAEDDQRALKYFSLAGDADAAVYANSEAVKHYSRALEIARRTEASSEVLINLYTRLGRALELDSQFDQVLATYQEMEQLAEQRDDRSLQLAAWMARLPLYGTQSPLHDPAQGRTLGEQALTLAQELNDPVAEAKILWSLMNLYSFTNKLAQAISYGERALALARQHNLREQMAYVINDLGSHCYALHGPFDKAKEYLREASDLWRELGNLPMLSDSLTVSCMVCVWLGEYDQAVAFSEEAFQVSQSFNHLWGQSYSRSLVGYVHWERGQPDRAIAVMEESIRLSEVAGFVLPQVNTRADLAAIYGGLGLIAPGLEMARLALTVADAQLPFFKANVLAIVAQLHLLAGNLVEAKDAIRQGQADPHWTENSIWFLPVVIAEAELKLKQGDYERAMGLFDTLLANSRRVGMRAYNPKALYLQGQALLALGQDEVARDHLGEARSEAEALGARWLLWQILTTLAQIEPDPTEAAALRRQAQGIIEYIADHTPTPELRTSFLNLPQVRAVFEPSTDD